MSKKVTGKLNLLITWVGLALILPAYATDFSAMDETAQSFSNIKTVQIAHKGEVIWAKAYNGANLDSETNIKSASKTLMSTIVGIAISTELGNRSARHPHGWQPGRHDACFTASAR